MGYAKGRREPHAMNKVKAKSPSPGNRMFPKRWRSKTKAVPAVSSTVAMWTPGPLGSCVWSSVSGRKVQLRPVSILNLTEPERMVLQKIALSKLQSMDIGCPVSVPIENADQRRAKKSQISLKRRSKSVTSSALDTMVKDGTSSGLVFGIPLIKCLMNDRELEKSRNRRYAAVGTGSPSSIKKKSESSENVRTSRSPRKSSCSSQGSFEISSGMVSHKPETLPSHKRAASIDSLSESESSRNTSSSLIDALSLSTSNPASRLSSLAMDGGQLANQSEAQVPYVVKACFRHIETFGLQTLGIFRVGSSKKRVKQLREEFDSGRDVRLTEEHNPHDVGALLKEYFRDLPDPLLTRELYLPFLHAERLKDEHKKHLALSLLISMLPVANRDTLWALLQFLAIVSQHATDSADEKGEIVSGNKMDAHNLATLFGPNIIHRSKADKSSDKDMLSESAERVEQSKEIIEVIKDMIDNHHELYEISGSIRDEILRLLIESNQEVTDKILRHIANQNQIETDPESMCSVFEDSCNSPMLYHSLNSDADLLAYAQRQTTDLHRPLRITKSADDSLDSPVLKSRVPILSESQAFSPASRDNHRTLAFNPLVRSFGSNQGYPSPVPNRIPVLRVYPESTNPEMVFPGRSKMGSLECPNSEEFNKSLNIPQPSYFRKYSSSSTGSDLSCYNCHGGSENGLSGHWVLPTPPLSRSNSPKPFFQSSSSSSTLVASPAPSLLNHPQAQDSDHENNPPFGSAEWERDRWKLWEKIAAQKKNMETEQETLV